MTALGKPPHPGIIAPLTYRPTAQFFQTNTPVLVIAGSIFWTNASKSLDAADIFATISLTRLVSSPMTTLLLGLPQVTSLFACFSRIQSFLLLESYPGISNSVASGSEKPSSSITKQDTLTFNGESKDYAAVQPIEKDQPLMEMRNVSIYPSADAEAVLHNVDLQIQRSLVTVIVGPVASGKTTLLRAIIGESRIEGFMMSAGGKDTGYCDQVPWLKNVSIRDNITNVDKFDSVWYQTVLRSCLLDEDMQQLSDADATLAGSGGANLSGGQKQRVVRDIQMDCIFA